MKIGAWLQKHDGILGELSEANEAMTTSAGWARLSTDAAGRAGAAAEFDSLRAAADVLLTVTERGLALPAIPDPATDFHFRAALGHWHASALAIRDQAASLDPSPAEFERAAAEHRAGGDSFYAAGVAIRKATGQPPLPDNH